MYLGTQERKERSDKELDNRSDAMVFSSREYPVRDTGCVFTHARPRRFTATVVPGPPAPPPHRTGRRDARPSNGEEPTPKRKKGEEKRGALPHDRQTNLPNFQKCPT
eukprot:scaffold9508_cov169-Skeletonema_menzelii.AAC.10